MSYLWSHIEPSEQVREGRQEFARREFKLIFINIFMTGRFSGNVIKIKFLLNANREEIEAGNDGKVSSQNSINQSFKVLINFI